MEYNIGDIVRTKKPHPCGCKLWEITRVGVDFKLKCTNCGHYEPVNKKLFAKVGAGGLCVVVNTKTQEGFAVKIADCDMKARELVVIEMLKKLGWADIEVDKTIKTLHGQIVGRVEVELQNSQN